MKGFVLGAIVSVTAVACTTEETSTVASDVSVSRRYLVVFKSESLPRDAASKISKAGGAVVKTLPNLGLALVTGTEQVAGKLATDPAVLSVGAEHYFTASDDEASEPAPMGDYFLPLQWDMRRIGAPALWERSLPASRVAVIDTGVMSDHLELQGVVTYGKTTSYCAGDEPGKLGGYPNYNEMVDVNLVQCVPNDIGTRFIEAGFHGSHVAGTIAAPRDNGGIVGVSPTTQIDAYKVFDLIVDNGYVMYGAFDFPIFAAIEDAVSRGTKVINMSLGGGLDRSLRDHNTAWLAWQRVTSWASRKGTLIIGAAGNDAANSNGTLAFIPSDLPSVMSVSATGTNQWVGSPVFGFDELGAFLMSEFNAAPGSDVVAFYSNTGAAVDISAPGGDCGPLFDCWSFETQPHQILSACAMPAWEWVGPEEWDWAPADRLENDLLCFAMGTSMAAPHVAGVAAAVRALHPSWTPGQTRSWLKDTADVVGGRQGFGAGIVNADLATR